MSSDSFIEHVLSLLHGSTPDVSLIHEISSVSTALEAKGIDPASLSDDQLRYIFENRHHLASDDPSADKAAVQKARSGFFAICLASVSPFFAEAGREAVRTAANKCVEAVIDALRHGRKGSAK